MHSWVDWCTWSPYSTRFDLPFSIAWLFSQDDSSARPSNVFLVRWSATSVSICFFALRHSLHQLALSRHVSTCNNIRPHPIPSVYEREAARWRPSVWPCVSRTDRGLGTGSHPYPEADWIGSIRVDPFRSGARSRPDLDTCPGCPSEGTRGGDLEGNNRLPRPWGTPEITVFQPYWLRTVDSGNTPGLLERNPRL